MKRVLALFVMAVMVVCSFASCSTLEGDDKGAVVTVYLGDEIYDFDPAQAYTNDTLAQVTSLIFEGLTTLDSNGDWKKGMMDSYKLITDDDGNEKLQITLRETKWSDGRTVQANDFVYAWKRILEPTFDCEAACLLYDIKNARDIKMGDATVDDLGVYAVETYVLEIEFDHKIDVDSFLRTCASPALVPLREDKIGTSTDWAKKSTTIVTNGPFDVRKIEYGKEFRVERSSYYFRDSEKNEALDKYVIPYRIRVLFKNGDESKQLDYFVNGTGSTSEVFYLGDIALQARGEYKDAANVSNALNTVTYYFNVENSLFEDAKVRQALSMAIDREAIAEAIVFAEAATGFVPAGISDAKLSDEFRDGNDIIATGADIEGAKKLLSEAGAKKGSFTITCRDDEVDQLISGMVAEAWNSLGYNVTVEALSAEPRKNQQANESIIYDDLYAEAYLAGDFDVIAVDSQALANDAYAVLALYATKYSGYGVDMESDDYAVRGHISGYASEEYDALIDKAFDAETLEDRAAALHEAEAKLCEDMPACPVVFLKNAYLVNEDVISGVKTTFWGTSDFKKMKMKDYMDYKAAIDAEEIAEAAGANS